MKNSAAESVPHVGKLPVTFCFRAVSKFVRSDDGPTAVEYAVMLALIVISCLTAINGLSQATAASFTETSAQMSNAFSGSSSP